MHLKHYDDIPLDECFILTMRNVNTCNRELANSEAIGFILTMRNVNVTFEDVLNSNKKVLS